MLPWMALLQCDTQNAFGPGFYDLPLLVLVHDMYQVRPRWTERFEENYTIGSLKLFVVVMTL